MPFHQGLYTDTKRIISLNTLYIANLIALRRWYLDVRKNFFEMEAMGQALHQGAVEKLDLAIEERMRRLGDVAARMPQSIEIYKKISGERVSEKTIRNKQDFFDKPKNIRSESTCPYCKNAIEENSKFCRMCGAYPI